MKNYKPKGRETFTRTHSDIMDPVTSKRTYVFRLVQHIILLGLELKFSSALHDTEDYKTLMMRLLNQFDSRVPPNVDEPTEVQIGITVDQIISIRNEDMSLTLKLMLHQTWIDPRYIVNSTYKEISLTADKVFVPDTFIRLVEL